MRRVDPFDRPLDRVLTALRTRWPREHVYRGHPERLNVWVARCPVCQLRSVFTLTITELGNEDAGNHGGEVRFACWSRCDERLIHLALGIPVPKRTSAPDPVRREAA